MKLSIHGSQLQANSYTLLLTHTSQWAVIVVLRMYMFWSGRSFIILQFFFLQIYFSELKRNLKTTRISHPLLHFSWSQPRDHRCSRRWRLGPFQVRSVENPHKRARPPAVSNKTMLLDFTRFYIDTPGLRDVEFKCKFRSTWMIIILKCSESIRSTFGIMKLKDRRAKQRTGQRGWGKMKEAKQMKNKQCYWKTGCSKTRGPGINTQISIQIIYLNFWSAILFKGLNPEISRCYAKKLRFLLFFLSGT